MNRFFGWVSAGAGIWLMYCAYKDIGPLQGFQSLLTGQMPTSPTSAPQAPQSANAAAGAAGSANPPKGVKPTPVFVPPLGGHL